MSIEVYISQHKSATREEEGEPGDEVETVSLSPSRQFRDPLEPIGHLIDTSMQVSNIDVRTTLRAIPG